MKIVYLFIAGLLVISVLGIAAFAAANWRDDRPVAELAARWAQPPSQFLDIAGMSVHVRDQGVANDPVPIVLIHGLSSNCAPGRGGCELSNQAAGS